MCGTATVTPSVSEAIKKTVAEKCAAKESFTAFEITKAIRKQGFTEYHSTIRDIVHEGYDLNRWMPDYRKRAFDIGGGIQAIVYYHRETDPEVYVDEIRRANGSVVTSSKPDLIGADGVIQPPPVTPATINVMDNGMVITDITEAFKKNPLIVKDVDHINRLRFTKPMLNAAGFMAGDQVSVSFTNGSIILGKPSAAGQGDVSGVHRIDERTNLRLSLEWVGYTAKAYKMTVAGDKILAHPVA
jgi:hypothetical protein